MINQRLAEIKDERRRRRLELVAIFFLFFSIFALTNCGVDESEGSQHFVLAEHIVRTGSLGFNAPQQWKGFVRAPNSHYYCAHELGNTLFMLPLASLTVWAEHSVHNLSPSVLRRAKGFLLSFLSPAYSAATCVFFFLILRSQCRKSLLEGAAGTALMALTTFFWPYSRLLFDGVLACTLLIGSFYFLTKYLRQQNVFDMAASACLLGFAIITRITVVLAVVPSACCLLLAPITRRQKAIGTITALVVLAPFAAWQMYYNELRTGSMFLSPLMLLNSIGLDPWTGPIGLLCSPGKSILIYVPLSIVSVLVVKQFWKDHRPVAIYTLVLCTLWFWVHALKQPDFWGEWGLGPRYFVTIVPWMILPAASELSTIARSMRLSLVSLITAGFGLIFALSCIVVDFGFRITYLEATGYSISELVWGGQHSQTADILSAAFENIVRMIHHSPIQTLAGTKLAETSWPMAVQYASSTINIWPNTLLYLGVPRLAVILATAAFVLMFACSIVALVYLAKRNDMRRFRDSNPIEATDKQLVRSADFGVLQQ